VQISSLIHSWVESKTMILVRGYGVSRHFQQYFSYIVVSVLLVEETCHPNQTNYPDAETTILCSFSFMLYGEATNINFIVFDLTWSGLESMIYSTRGKHANHYNTHAIWNIWLSALVQTFLEHLAFSTRQDVFVVWYA
jgi:hypothetical protein